MNLVINEAPVDVAEGPIDIHMDTSAAVNQRRVFVREEERFHDGVLTSRL